VAYLRNLEASRKTQRDIASKVIVKDNFKSPPSIVAGVDLAFLEEDGNAA
jgi:deoxyinosine 3'endonuclease (endonuclease V)